MFAAYGGRTQASAKPYVKVEDDVRVVDLVQLRKERAAQRKVDARTADRKLANELIAKGREAARIIAERDAKALAEYRAKRMKIELEDMDLPRHISSYRTIERRICRALGVRPAEIRCKRRSADLVFARHAIMYWACRQTEYSLPQIGRMMGGRDHSTVLWGRKQYVEKRASQGRTLREAR